MSWRVKGKTTLGSGAFAQTEVENLPIELREVTVDGYTFHFGPNEVKNFLDDGVGNAVASFNSGDSVSGNPLPFGNERS